MQEKIQREGSGLHDLAIAHQHVLFEICDLRSNFPTAKTTGNQIKTLSPQNYQMFVICFQGYIAVIKMQ